MQDIVDPFTDEILARFVVDSHAISQPKGANLEDRVPTDVGDDPLAAARQADPDVCILSISTERTSYSVLWF
jgi:DNA replication licensing factor MCM2